MAMASTLDPVPAGCLPLKAVLEPDDSPAVRAARLTEQQYAKIKQCMEDGSRAARVEGLARTLLASYRGSWTRYSELLRMRDGTTLVVDPGSSHGVDSGHGPSSSAGTTNGVSGDDEGNGARFFTAREATRLMGFPESFLIPGRPDARGGKPYEHHLRYYHQIGNAVCPPVVRAIAEPLLAALEAAPSSTSSASAVSSAVNSASFSFTVSNNSSLGALPSLAKRATTALPKRPPEGLASQDWRNASRDCSHCMCS